MKFRPYCGAKLGAESAKFCSECGSKLPHENNIEVTEEFQEVKLNVYDLGVKLEETVAKIFEKNRL